MATSHHARACLFRRHFTAPFWRKRREKAEERRKRSRGKERGRRKEKGYGTGEGVKTHQIGTDTKQPRKYVNIFHNQKDFGSPFCYDYFFFFLYFSFSPWISQHPGFSQYVLSPRKFLLEFQSTSTLKFSRFPF